MPEEQLDILVPEEQRPYSTAAGPALESKLNIFVPEEQLDIFVPEEQRLYACTVLEQVPRLICGKDLIAVSESIKEADPVGGAALQVQKISNIRC